MLKIQKTPQDKEDNLFPMKQPNPIAKFDFQETSLAWRDASNKIIEL